MTAKQWLMRARNMEMRIEALEEAKNRMYDRATSITAKLSKAPSSGGASRPGDKIAGYAVASDLVEKQKAKLRHVQEEILQLISEIEDNTIATLLIEYYINGKTWVQVSDKLGYSTSHVTKTLHPQALDDVTGILEAKGILEKK